VLLTVKRTTPPNLGDPMGQRGSFEVGPLYHPTLEEAVNDISTQLAVHEAKEALTK
jgi:hypothetical protein